MSLLASAHQNPEHAELVSGIEHQNDALRAPATPRCDPGMSTVRPCEPDLDCLSDGKHADFSMRAEGMTSVSRESDRHRTPVTPPCDPLIPRGHTLSRKQALVLNELIHNPSRMTSYSMIGSALGLSKPAVRDAVEKLCCKGYISRPETVRDGVFQGFRYWLDVELCRQFVDSGGVSNEKFHGPSHTCVIPPTHTVRPPSFPPHTTFSSSSEQKLTTHAVNLEDPELRWWKEQGLRPRQIESWLEEFKMTVDELTISLRYARFDVLVNEIKVGGAPINNVLNWFYRILSKAGMYARPANYKSLYEMRAEALRAQLQQDEEVRRQIRELECEARFRQIMSDPESEDYQSLLSQVSDFTVNLNSKTVLERELKDIFLLKVEDEHSVPGKLTYITK